MPKVYVGIRVRSMGAIITGLWVRYKSDKGLDYFILLVASIPMAEAVFQLAYLSPRQCRQEASSSESLRYFTDSCPFRFRMYSF